MLTPSEKSLLPEKKFSSEEDRIHDASSSRTASPARYQRAIPSPEYQCSSHCYSWIGENRDRTPCLPLSRRNRIFGLVVTASASRAEHPGFESRLSRDFSGVESYQWLKKLALQWLSCQTPGGIGSVLGLVGPVSVYCDWVRRKVGSATSDSVWQHVKLSEQIRP